VEEGGDVPFGSVPLIRRWSARIVLAQVIVSAVWAEDSPAAAGVDVAEDF
jgi:hypothetical protein